MTVTVQTAPGPHIDTPYVGEQSGIAPDGQTGPALDLPGRVGLELAQNIAPTVEKSPAENFKGLGHLALDGVFIQRLRESVGADKTREREIANERLLSSRREHTVAQVGTQDQQPLIPPERQITPGRRTHRSRGSRHIY